MNWLDVLIIVIIAVPMAIGLRVGLVRTVTGLVSLAVGTLLATLFWRQTATIVGVFIPDENLAALAGYFIILLLTVAAGWAAAVFIKTALTVLLLGWVDKVGGIAFGAAVGSVIVAAVIWSLESFSGAGVQEAVDTSALRPYFTFLVPILRRLSGEVDLSTINSA